MKFVSAIVDIGRQRINRSARPISFYTGKLATLRERVRPYEVVVYGNVPGYHDIPFSFSDILGTIGRTNYDRLEYLRVTGEFKGPQAGTSWYSALCLGKLALLVRELLKDQSLAHVYWLDAGSPGHTILPEVFRNFSPKSGFNLALSQANKGWHGAGFGERLPGRHIQGGLFGGDRESVLLFAKRFYAEMESCLSQGQHPLDEDLFNIIEQKTDFPALRLHEGFVALGDPDS